MSVNNKIFTNRIIQNFASPVSSEEISWAETDLGQGAIRIKLKQNGLREVLAARAKERALSRLRKEDG